MQQSMGGASASQNVSESVRTQLDALNSELDQERTANMDTMRKAIDEKELVEKRLEESKENENKIKEKMAQLAEELDRTIKRVDQLQTGNPGYGNRARGRMNFAGSPAGSNNSGSRNNSNKARPAY